MQVRCPYCQHPIEIPKGGQYTCEKCRAIFRVDMDAPAAAPPPAGAGGPEPAAATPGWQSQFAPQPPPPISQPVAPAARRPPGARCARHPEVEAVAVCARCGNFTCGSCSVLLPSGRYCPDCAERLASADFSTPWEQRQQLGFWPAFAQTAKSVVLTPTAFFKKMPRAGGYEGPVLFAIIWGAIGALVQGTIQMVLIAAVGIPLRGQGTEVLTALLGGGVVGLLTGVVLSPITTILSLFVGAGIFHLGLMTTGGAKNGFEATIRAGAYLTSLQLVLMFVMPFLVFAQIGAMAGAGAGVNPGVMIVPGIIMLVVFYWLIRTTVVAYREAHDTSTGRALGIFLVPLAIGCCCGMIPILIALSRGGFAR